MLEKTIESSKDLAELNDNRHACRPHAMQISNKYSAEKISTGMQDCMEKIKPRLSAILERSNAQQTLDEIAAPTGKKEALLAPNDDFERPLERGQKNTMEEGDLEGLLPPASAAPSTRDNDPGKLRYINECAEKCQTTDRSATSQASCIQACQQ